MIVQISVLADKALTLKPNVILLMARTNDHIFGSMVGKDPKATPARMEALLDKIVGVLPDAVLLVTTLSPLNLEAGQYARLAPLTVSTEVFNSLLPAMSRARTDKGAKVAVIDMGAAEKGDLSDGIHPNEAGYAKMAAAWFKDMQRWRLRGSKVCKDAEAKGWIKKLPPA